MTVAELMTKLANMPRWSMVVVPGYETGAEEATGLRLVELEDRYHPRRADYHGRYDRAQGDRPSFHAVYISGDHDPL